MCQIGRACALTYSWDAEWAREPQQRPGGSGYPGQPAPPWLTKRKRKEATRNRRDESAACPSKSPVPPEGQPLAAHPVPTLLMLPREAFPHVLIQLQ